MSRQESQRLLLTGASGQLGSYLLRELAVRQPDCPVTAWGHSGTGESFGFPLRGVDLCDADATALAFDDAHPDVIVHTAALSNAEKCVRDPDLARRTNVEATSRLAELATRASARLVYVSTDCVFDGQRGWYCEQDIPVPTTVYGRTKFEAEQVVLAVPAGVVVRVSLLFGPTLMNRSTFFDAQVQALKERRPCRLFEDEWRTPLDYLTAARGLLAIARSDFEGTIHLAGLDRLSRYEMGQRVAAFLGCGDDVLLPPTRDQSTTIEPRPKDISLDCPQWHTHFVNQPRPAWKEAIRQVFECRNE